MPPAPHSPANDTRAGLEGMRRRLLDLTGNNRLLNFKFTKNGSLRFTQASLNHVSEHLYAEQTSLLKATPPAKRELRWDVDEEDDDKDREPRRSGLEIGDRPSQGNGKPAGRAVVPTVAEAARHAGISTSFDLEGPTADHPSQLQCLLYPEDLEKIARKISGAARSAIEETGSNLLHLIFGFLEWYESDESELPRLAPLLTLPVSLQKTGADPATGVIRYGLEAADGERLSANYCLAELLRRDFNLQLPPLRLIGDEEESEAPESYFQKVDAMIAAKGRWKVRRQLTLGLLSFGKLLMYRDLDPETWPPGQGPDAQARVREFFEGIVREEAPSHSPEYSLDESGMRGRVPELVLDADSSQHSALIDALEGKNLVIEGPPGTGKSQTITNLIVAAMVRGKSVLFVAEKLAALEVVRNRLDHTKLGIFCLELHSHKTQKRALLDDVQERLKAQGNLSDSHHYEERLALLEDQKRRLNEYAALIQQFYGARNQSIHDLLWAMERARVDLGEQERGDELATLQIPDAERMETPLFEERANAVDAYDQHLAGVLAETEASLSAHPWRGVKNANLTFQEAGDAVRHLRDLQQQTSTLATRTRLFDARFQWTPPTDTPEKLLALTAVINRLPEPSEADSRRIFPECLPALGQEERRRDLTEFAARTEAYVDLRQHVVEASDLPNLPSPEQHAILYKTLAEIRKSCPVATHLKDVAAVADYLHWHADRLRELNAPLTGFCRRLGVGEVPERLDVLQTIQRVLDLAERAPIDDLHLGGLLPNAIVAGPFVREARREAEPIALQRDTLSTRFQLHAVPAADELDRLATVAANAGFFSFFSGKFRSAKGAYLGWSKAGQNFTKEGMRDNCHELSRFRQAETKFLAKEKYRASLGQLFEGLDTPFDQIERLVAWHEEIARLLTDGETSDSFAARCGKALMTASPGILYSTGELRPFFAARPDDHWTALHESLEACLQSYLPLEVVRPSGFTALAETLESFAGKLHSLADRFTEAGFSSEMLLSQIETNLADLDRLDALRRSILSDRHSQTVLGTYFEGTETDTRRVRATVDLASHVHGAEVNADVCAWLLQADAATRLASIRHEALGLAETLAAWERTHQAFAELVGLDVEDWLQSKDVPVERTAFDTLATRMNRALAAEASLVKWIAYLRTRRQLVSFKLTALVDRAEEGRLRTGSLRKVFRYIYSQSVMRVLFKAYPALEEFSGLTHEDVRRRFANLDAEILRDYRQRAACQIAARPVPYGISSGLVGRWTNRALLEREIAKQKRHLPIRQLVDRAGPALQALKPCFMMSPLSVAQYLKPGGLRFDLVVMDEASQLKPEDAMGAVARGGQLVIVGDPMQLPPTNFFDRMADGTALEEEDSLAVDGAESILDIASAIYQPLRRLRWHYRSRHESLIAFSNHEFYGGDLIVFPSPVASDEWLGVKWVHVTDGIYQDRCNRREAHHVVDAVLRHMRERPQESLGVVALNIVQKELIEDLFEKAVATDPAATRFLDKREQGLEPFFIKNLENVQGDERDVIFISVAYGPAAPGAPVLQRFGPITGASGHRRLNVLFTRAKHRVVIFSSMAADDLRVDETTSRGTRVLRNYLAYAKAGGRLEEQSIPTGRPPDSDFEVSVAAALRRHGYEVVPQVGVAGYFIDLAIRTPRKPGSYLLAVECDGATYHRSHSARDRDRLRQSVLEKLGWKIHRIWSTDWFKQPNREIERLVSRLQSLTQSASEMPAVPSPLAPPPGAPPIFRQTSAPIFSPTSREEGTSPPALTAQSRPVDSETLGDLFAHARRDTSRLPYDKARKSYRDWTERLVGDCHIGRSVGEELVKWAITGLQMGLESRSLNFLADMAMPIDQEEAANLFNHSVQELGVPHVK